MSLTQTQLIQGPVTPGGVTLALAETDIAAGAVGTTELASSAVTNAKIAAGAVTKAKMAFFGNHGNTGTGSSQNIAHGLGVTPTFVTVIFTGTTSSQTVTYGTHTSTNVVVTVTSAATFDVIAIA